MRRYCGPPEREDSISSGQNFRRSSGYCWVGLTYLSYLSSLKMKELFMGEWIILVASAAVGLIIGCLWMLTLSRILSSLGLTLTPHGSIKPHWLVGSLL